MNKRDSVIILIGEKGIIFTIHDKKTIKNKIFCDEFDEKVKETLDQELKKNKNHKIHIVLDTLDQSYKKKDFPMMKKGDLEHLVNREINSDPDKESLKNFLILDKIDHKSTIKNWQVLLISASISDNVQKILDYIYSLPNQITGIYLYPIESYNIIKKIVKDDNLTKKDSEIFCLITQNKVSGIRQTIFHNHQVLFTRLLDYSTDDRSFIKKYEKDLYASYEYLKRIYPDISIDHFKIINVFADKTIKQIEQMRNIEFNIINNTPYQISESFKEKFKIKENSQNSDILFTRSLFLSKKLFLPFFTPYISRGKKIYFIMRLSYFANLLILLTIGLFIYISVSKLRDAEDSTFSVEIKKARAINELSITNRMIKNFEDDLKLSIQEDLNGNQIIEISEIYELLANKNILSFKEYGKLNFISDLNLKIKTFSFNTKKFQKNNPAKNMQYSIYITGTLINQTGNVDELFISYDKIKAQFTENYKGYRVTISDLPKNINLAEKYYNFDIKINIDKQ